MPQWFIEKVGHAKGSCWNGVVIDIILLYFDLRYCTANAWMDVHPSLNYTLKSSHFPDGGGDHGLDQASAAFREKLPLSNSTCRFVVLSSRRLVVADRDGVGGMTTVAPAAARTDASTPPVTCRSSGRVAH
eukprot:2253534-Amphidinium_carterae.1